MKLVTTLNDSELLQRSPKARQALNDQVVNEKFSIFLATFELEKERKIFTKFDKQISCLKSKRNSNLFNQS